jgi:single-strand DNA-binding protein
MINEVTLVGYLGADAQVTTFDNGRKVSMFRIATSKTYTDAKGQEQIKTEWHNIVAWGFLADIPAKKGMMMFVKGEINYRKYTDKDNIERHVTDIVPKFMYEIVRKVRDHIPAPTESDIPPLFGAASRMNSTADVDDTPF